MDTSRKSQVAKSTINSQQSTVNNQRKTQHVTRNTLAAPGRIELHIGELALHGFDHVDSTQLGATVRQELSRLLTENGTPSALIQTGSMANLEGEAFTAAPGASADAIGEQIARAIYRGLER